MTAWDDEIAPTSLVSLRNSLVSALSLSVAVHTGIKGNEAHTSGYHRSRRWINEEGDPGTDYSVQDARDLTGNENWLAALDLTLSAELMILLSGRLLAASAAGLLPAQVRGWYGTVTGTTVAGWDVVDGGPSTADSSHLRHIHVEFFRSMAGDSHTAVLALLLATSRTAANAATAALTPGTATTVAVTGTSRYVHITNRSPAGIVWARADGGVAGVAGEDSFPVAPMSTRVVDLDRRRTVTVSLIANHVAEYTVAGSDQGG